MYGMYPKLTRKEQTRRRQIIRELSNLSRGGWYFATSQDWERLEAELRRINDKVGAATMLNRPKTFGGNHAVPMGDKNA